MWLLKETLINTAALTLGTDIPIVSEAESRAMNPDYYLVLPWHFKEEFLKREQEMLKKGVGLIFPLPAIDIVKAKFQDGILISQADCVR